MSADKGKIMAAAIEIDGLFKEFVEDEVFQEMKNKAIEKALSKPTALGYSAYSPVYKAGFYHGAYLAIGLFVARINRLQDRKSFSQEWLEVAQAIHETP